MKLLPPAMGAEGSSGFLKRSQKNTLRLHSEVSQMSTIEIPVELQVRGCGRALHR